MRINLNIADDVLVAVNERARREKCSAGEVLTELLHEALTGRGGTARIVEGECFFDFQPFPHRGPAVSNEFIDRLRDIALE